MSSISITPLSSALGARIDGADIARLDDETFEAIERALHEHLVVILPRQSIEPAAFVAFSRRFGRPEPHVIDQFHHKADPNILILSNRKNEQGEPIGLADGGTYFHTDYSYRPAAPCSTRSRSREAMPARPLPTSGGRSRTSLRRSGAASRA